MPEVYFRLIPVNIASTWIEPHREVLLEKVVVERGRQISP